MEANDTQTQRVLASAILGIARVVLSWLTVSGQLARVGHGG